MSELGKLYWELIEPVWTSVNIYQGGERFLADFANLTPAQRHLLASHWCQSEICNGGLHQFFANPTGVLAPEAAFGFDAIGLQAAGAVVRRALSFFGTPYPRDQAARRELLRAVPGESRREWDPFYHLDDAFYAAIESSNDGYQRHADAYARANASAHK